MPKRPKLIRPTRATSRRMSEGRLISPELDAIDWGKPRSAVRLPTLPALKNMETGALQQQLKRWGVTNSWDDMRKGAETYLKRLTKIPPGSKEFEQQVKNLTDSESRRFLLGANRRLTREYQTLLALDGKDPNKQEFIRIAESDDHTCDECEERSGFIGTMGEQDELGKPGIASCLGGEYCRCELVLLD